MKDFPTISLYVEAGELHYEIITDWQGQGEVGRHKSRIISLVDRLWSQVKYCHLVNTDTNTRVLVTVLPSSVKS